MDFRKVTAIFRPARLEAVEEKLRSMDVPGISKDNVQSIFQSGIHSVNGLCV